MARPLLYGLAMQSRLALTVAALAATFPPTIAIAQPSAAPATTEPAADSSTSPSGLGVGFARTLDGTWGPSLRLGRDLQVELVVGGNMYRVGDCCGQSRQDVAARVLIPLLRRDRGWLGLVGGLAGHRLQFDDDSGTRTMWTGSAEAGVHAEWFIAPALSLGLEVGASGSVGGDVVDLEGGDHYTENGWYSSGLGRATGAASLTYWLGVDDEAKPRPSGLRLGVGAMVGLDGHGLALALDAGRLRLEVAGSREAAGNDLGSWHHGRVGLGALYEVARSGPVALSTGLRTSAAQGSDGAGDYTYVGAAVPLRMEVDVAPWLSLYTEGGIEATFEPDRDVIGGDLGATGMIGFTAWL